MRGWIGRRELEFLLQLQNIQVFRVHGQGCRLATQGQFLEMGSDDRGNVHRRESLEHGELCLGAFHEGWDVQGSEWKFATWFDPHGANKVSGFRLIPFHFDVLLGVLVDSLGEEDIELAPGAGARRTIQLLDHGSVDQVFHPVFQIPQDQFHGWTDSDRGMQREHDSWDRGIVVEGVMDVQCTLDRAPRQFTEIHRCRIGLLLVQALARGCPHDHQCISCRLQHIAWRR